jgi:peptide deformylase
MADEAGQIIEEDHELDPEEETRRRLALAQIRQWGDPALRLRAHEIESFDDDLKRLVERMTELMHDARGVGLAATQVGVLQRLFVFQLADDDVRAIVNPVISELSGNLEADEEGCLSLQGVRVPVERQLKLVLEGKDETGEDVRLELAGVSARIVQHELDHLDGVLILDRTDPESRRQALGVLRPQPLLGAAS